MTTMSEKKSTNLISGLRRIVQELLEVVHGTPVVLVS